jgi:hypothetical protein
MSTNERRLGGAGAHLTPAEKREIALAFLTDPELGSISKCAAHFNRTREAVTAVVRSDDFEKLKQEVDIEAGASAKRILQGAREKAARAWVNTAIDAAAERGDHKPSRDLLLHTKVLDPLAQMGHGAVVVVLGDVIVPGIDTTARAIPAQAPIDGHVLLGIGPGDVTGASD